MDKGFQHHRRRVAVITLKVQRKGYCAGILGRWLFTALSGWIFFAEYAWEGWHPLPYTFAYNGCYIFAEAAITYLLLAIPYVRKTFARVKQIAVQP